VQALPSSQRVPFGFGAAEHCPVPGSQTPASWHASLAGQTTGAPPVQTPASQTSPFVHALPSLHAVPSGLGAFAH
jgi:hypothetical protein